MPQQAPAFADYATRLLCAGFCLVAFIFSSLVISSCDFLKLDVSVSEYKSSFTVGLFNVPDYGADESCIKYPSDIDKNWAVIIARIGAAVALTMGVLAFLFILAELLVFRVRRLPILCLFVAGIMQCLTFLFFLNTFCAQLNGSPSGSSGSSGSSSSGSSGSGSSGYSGYDSSGYSGYGSSGYSGYGSSGYGSSGYGSSGYSGYGSGNRGIKSTDYGANGAISSITGGYFACPLALSQGGIFSIVAIVFYSITGCCCRFCPPCEPYFNLWGRQNEPQQTDNDKQVEAEPTTREDDNEKVEMAVVVPE